MRTSSAKKWLLAVCLLFLAVETASAQNIWRTLMVKPEQEYCFAGETCAFTLIVPGYAPSRIDTTLQSTPDNVALISTTKEEIIENGKRSTKITLYFRFSKAGTYQIRNLAARIDWSWNNIPFQRITVYDNPITLAPELFLNYPTTIYASEPFEMEVSAHFFSEFTDLAAQLDENFIVRLKEYKSPLPIKTGGFSTDQYPIAVYEIIPLTEGKLALPAITALMRSYAGVQQTVVSSSPTVKVLPKRAVAASPDTTPEEENEETMEQKFLSSAYEDFPIIEISMQENRETAVLTAEEQWIALKNRRSTMNLVILLSSIVAVLGVLLFPAGLILLLKQKTKALFIISIVLAALGFATLFPMLWFAHPRYAVCYETNGHTIPEDESNTILMIQEGTVVRIITESSDWFCIDTEHAGLVWVKKSQCLVE